MRRLVLHSASFKTYWAHYYFFADPQFASRLRERGYRLTLSEGVELEKNDYLLFMDATSVGLERFSIENRLKEIPRRALGRSKRVRDLYTEAQGLGLGPGMAVLISESEMWLPSNFDPALHDMFAAVLTWHDDLVDGKRYHKFQLGQPLEWPSVGRVRFRGRRLLVSISANKYSRHAMELYSERRRAIRYFERAWPSDYDLYGVGWNLPATRLQRMIPCLTPHYPSYRGEARLKASVFPRYRFALCYENACHPGWVTEKMLDAIRSGCVPVYLGAPNIADYVDSGAFVGRQQFTTDQELGEFLRQMDESTHARYLEAGADYLASSKFKRFLVSAFADRIADVMDGLGARSAHAATAGAQQRRQR